jgi:hypothetical protein
MVRRIGGGVAWLFLVFLLLSSCSNPYCLEYSSADCDKTGCDSECVAWRSDSNWFERHILGKAIAILKTIFCGLAGYGAFTLYQRHFRNESISPKPDDKSDL